MKIILAHKDYPAEVEEERSAEEEDTEEVSSFFTNEKGTLEESLKEGLTAVLEAHLCLLKIYKTSKAVAKKGESSNSDEKKSGKSKMLSFKNSSEKILTLCENISPLGQILLKSLIPARGKALASVPPTLVATAYLAIEARKVLVYDRHEDRFTRASVFPHLQARAVMHSLQSYHANYKGDGRLIARQAILCSRRHGDFGRAFLPVNMPIQSRAIRDWLEILYIPKE